MKLNRTIPLLLLAWGLMAGRELVLNGSFEELDARGWRWDTFGLYPDSGNCHLWQSVYLDPDLDREVCVHKILHQWALLSQDVVVPNLNLRFSAAARLFCKTERPDTGYYACACLVLCYLDDCDSVLGETRILSRTGGCDWTSNARLHLIAAPDTNRWHSYALLLSDELNNLPGVNRSAIRKVRIGLWSYVRNNC